ncbi:MAG: hypothetical protein M3237_09510 [Actinomycetota bacterium]|nr:hypothetical protein [Actinomycetota bacterium]
MARNQERDVRRELVGLLLEKIETDTYPSTTMLAMVEQVLTPEEVPIYAGVLMDKARNDYYPSISLLARVRRLAAAV